MPIINNTGKINPSETHLFFVESLLSSTLLYVRTILDIPMDNTFTVSDPMSLSMWCDFNDDYVIGSGESWLFGLHHRNSNGNLVGFPAASYLYNDISAHAKFIISWDVNSYPLPYTFSGGDRLIIAIVPASANPAPLLQFNFGLIGVLN